MRIYLDALKDLKIQEGRLEALKQIKTELSGIRSRGERPTWDLWEGVIHQIEAETIQAVIAAVDAAILAEQGLQASNATIH